MSTLHRRDISAADLTKLALFCSVIAGTQWQHLIPCWNLPNFTMLLPVWYLAGSGWRLDKYKEFTMDAYGIKVADFRRACRYINVSEFDMVDTLYRMSMISVIPGQRLHEPPKFKMQFHGKYLAIDYWETISDEFGFVIECRRSDGKFR